MGRRMGWFSKTWGTISAALGVRRYMLPATTTALAAGITAGYGWIRSQPGWDWLPALPHWAAFVLVLLILVLIFILNYATKLRLDMEPEFEISFDGAGLGIVEAIEHQPVLGPHDEKEGWVLIASGRYIRIQIDSRSNIAISGLLPFITGLQFRPTADSEFIRINLPQNIPLSDRPLEIYPGLPHLVDFAKAVEADGDDTLMPTAPWPLVLEGALKTAGQYRFTLGVFSRNGNKSISVIVEWKGDVHTLEAHKAD
jgi:hypothetical protein